MSQILHILKKDTRHFWGEIFLSVAITAAFTWVYPNTWLGPDRIHGAMGNHILVSYELQALGNILIILVPVGWWILIARLVYAETLVGDRQFWLTRPYEWPKLLAAKLLFLLAFLYLPLLFAQCVLLAEAGFDPFSYIPGLLYNLMLLSAVIVLPILALATVTSNFARMTLTILGVFLGIVFLSTVVGRLMLSHFTAISSTSYTSIGGLIIAFCVCFTVIILQYAQRRVWLARAMLYGIPAILLITSPLISNIERHHTRIDADYPVATTPPVQLAYHPLQPGFQSFETYPDTGEVMIHAPLEGTGVALGIVLVPDAVKLEVEAPNGFHWTSDWQGTAMPKFFAGAQDGDAVVSMPRNVYEQMKTMPLTLHLSVALSEAKTTSSISIPLPTQEFSVPGFGVCSPLTGFMHPLPETGLPCRSALREPPLTYIGVVWSNAPCYARRLEPDPGVQGAAWVGSFDRAPAQLDISSVQSLHFWLSNSYKDQPSGGSRYLCPGSPVTFTEYERIERAQTSVTIHDFHLPGVNVENGQMHITTTTTTTVPAK